jgi:3-phenylpropionate/trans-cinnamate dioxygenase ferredoxin subunit
LFPGTKRRVVLGGVGILVVRHGDDIYAIRDRCSHEEYSLLDGTLHEGTVSCPQHGAQFDLKTGEALTPPAFEDLKTYPVRVNNGYVEVKADE